MTRVQLVIAAFALHAQSAFAQCIVTGIEIPEQVCLNSSFTVGNSSPAASFEWDFCPGELQAGPSVQKAGNTRTSSTIDLEIATDGDLVFGFAADASSNSLVRFDFGNSPDHMPARVNLGNIDGLFAFPNAVSIVKQGGTWIGLVANGSNNKIILLDFGADLSNTPIATELYSRAAAGFVSMSVAQGNGNSATLIIGEFNSQVSIIHYPQGFLMPPAGSQSVAIPGSTPIDVQVLKECDSWKVLVLSFDNRKIYQVNFGDSFLNTPAILPYAVTFAFEPYRLSLVREGGHFFGFASSTSGGLSRLDFENSLDNNPAIVALGNFGSLSNSRSLFVGSLKSQWRGFMINFSDGDLFRLSFTKDCGISPANATGRDPGILQFRSAGQKTIAVTASLPDGTLLSASEQLTVTSQPAPEFSIQVTNSCVDHEVLMTSTLQEENITTYQWSFGDGNVSSVPAPSHIYTSAQSYAASLFVRDLNSCSTVKQFDVDIFYAPESQFDLPSQTPLCSYQLLEFTNTTEYAPGSTPRWRWFVNAVEISDARDLKHEFREEGTHTVRLMAGIPGCESSSEQLIGPLAQGVDLDFDTPGVCLGTASVFQNNSDGSVLSFLWEFGDGNTAAEQHATHTYADFGDYEVTLGSTTGNGCNNSESKFVTIHALPVVEFSTSGPRDQCAGAALTFFDQSSTPDGASITEWRWNFGDGSEPVVHGEGHAVHHFSEGGVFNVSLAATTAHGCGNAIALPMTIFPQPSTSYSSSPACDDVPVTFTGPSGNGINSWYWEIGNSYYITNSPTHTFNTPGDYPLYLEVSDANGCSASVRKTLRVPRPLATDFSVFKNCVGHETQFTEITSGEESVSSRQWLFQGIEFSVQSTATYTFEETGSRTVRLKVTSASGCQYQADKQVMIVQSPVAGFTASPSSGAAPLEVLFANTSAHATRYRWDFGDGSGLSPTEASPRHKFADVGAFEVTLTAANEQSCERTQKSTIATVMAFPDVVLDKILLSPNRDGSSRIIITIHNKGNTILKNLPVFIDLSGGLELLEKVGEPIGPGAKYNLVLSPALVNTEDLRYICAHATLDNDLYPGDNKICMQLERTLRVFPVFPNPLNGILHLEWLSVSGQPVSIRLMDGLGRDALSTSTESVDGFNERDILLNDLAGGLYYLFVEQGGARHLERVMILRNP